MKRKKWVFFFIFCNNIEEMMGKSVLFPVYPVQCSLPSFVLFLKSKHYYLFNICYLLSFILHSCPLTFIGLPFWVFIWKISLEYLCWFWVFQTDLWILSAMSWSQIVPHYLQTKWRIRHNLPHCNLCLDNMSLFVIKACFCT